MRWNFTKIKDTECYEKTLNSINFQPIAQWDGKNEILNYNNITIFKWSDL